MIIGIGTDPDGYDRSGKAALRGGLKVHAFTEEERRQAEGRTSFLAGCFAVRKQRERTGA